MSYVIAAYAFSIALVGGYALSIVLRRRAVRRELAAAGEGQSTGATEQQGDAGQPTPGRRGAEAP